MRHGAYQLARRAFFDVRRGCGVVFAGEPCQLQPSMRGCVSSALHEMLGDDVDGIAAMMEDYNDED